MLKSMTGFGRGEYEDEQFSVTIEMKTVNHRYNEVAIRLPRFLNPVEDRIRKTILKSVIVDASMFLSMLLIPIQKTFRLK